MPEITEQHERLRSVFEELRRAIPTLGVKELLDALSLLDHGYGEDDAALRRAVRLLWLRSGPEEREFDRVWRAHLGREDPARAQDGQPIEEQSIGELEN